MRQIDLDLPSTCPMNHRTDRVCLDWLRSLGCCSLVAIYGCTGGHDPATGALEIIPPRSRSHLQMAGRRSSNLSMYTDSASLLTTATTTSTHSQKKIDNTQSRETIARILHSIAVSKEIFVAPRSQGPAIEYTGSEFSRMLKSKWEWFGSDIHAIDQWVEQIATRSFRYYLPYVIKDRRKGEKKLSLVAWIEEQGLYSAPKSRNPSASEQ